MIFAHAEAGQGSAAAAALPSLHNNRKKGKMGISNKGLQTISTIQCSQMDQSIVRLLVQIRGLFTNVQLLMRKEFKTRLYIPRNPLIGLL